jgi:hypothetical protein
LYFPSFEQKSHLCYLPKQNYNIIMYLITLSIIYLMANSWPLIHYLEWTIGIQTSELNLYLANALSIQESGINQSEWMMKSLFLVELVFQVSFRKLFFDSIFKTLKFSHCVMLSALTGKGFPYLHIKILFIFGVETSKTK